MRAGRRPKGAGAAALAALALLAAADPARAEGCAVGLDPVLFESYDSLSQTGADGVGTVHIRCDTAVTFEIALASDNAGLPSRRMQSGASALEYHLYRDAARQMAWGDGTQSGTTVSGTGPQSDLTVYGRIAPGQNVAAGVYSDTVTVTVVF